MWCGEGLAWAVVELVAEMIFYLLSSGLEQVVGIRGAGVDLVMDPGAVLGVIIGAKGGLPVANGHEGAEGVEVALDSLGHDNVVLVLILDGNGDVVCEVVPIGLDVVFKHLAVDIDTGVSGGLGDIAGKGVGNAFKWKDGKGISVTNRTVYDLRVCEKTS
jgi:hypothetical protein